MKKTTLINAPLSGAIASLGHTDMLVIADAGLPIPDGPLRIDLALTKGVPDLEETLRVILSEMKVESAVIAEESHQRSPQVETLVLNTLKDIPVKTIPHVQLKELSKKARVIVRTGEFTPFANVILVSGVVF